MAKNKRAVCLLLFISVIIVCTAMLHIGAAGDEKDKQTASCTIPIALVSNEDTLKCTFLLEAADNAPMPIGEPVISLYSGEAAFPAIEYDMPGIYQYTVRQTTENAPKGWLLDERVLAVTVYVTSNDDGMLDTSVITSFTGGEAKDNLFKNCCGAPDTGDGAKINLTVTFVVIAAAIAIIPSLLKKKKEW